MDIIALKYKTGTKRVSKTRKGKYCPEKIDRVAAHVIKVLNKDEVGFLVDRLVDFLEGDLQIKTLQRIRASTKAALAGEGAK